MKEFIAPQSGGMSSQRIFPGGIVYLRHLLTQERVRKAPLVAGIPQGLKAP